MSTTNIGTYILPDTAIAAATTDEIIFTYFQLYSGQLIENVSPDGKNWETTIIDVTSWETVKLFTPLAAVAFGQLGGKRYLFYLDHENVLNDLVYDGPLPHKESKWRVGNLKKLNITTADYSKLAAMITGKTIHVFYQTGDKSGDIGQVVGSNDKWELVVNKPGIPWLRAPLYSTSLAAAEVLFFQEANLLLAVWNGKDKDSHPLELNPKASPHTPLAAVNEGDNIFLFYTSDENEIRLIPLYKGEPEIGTLAVQPTTPKGNLAAVVWKAKLLGAEEDIIVFYQPQISNIVTQNIIPINAAWFTLTGTGKERKVSAPVVKKLELQV